jgi:hypothetical protein
VAVGWRVGVWVIGDVNVGEIVVSINGEGVIPLTLIFGDGERVSLAAAEVVGRAVEVSPVRIQLLRSTAPTNKAMCIFLVCFCISYILDLMFE